MKRIMTFVLVAAMLFSMMVPALAITEQTGQAEQSENKPFYLLQWMDDVLTEGDPDYDNIYPLARFYFNKTKYNDDGSVRIPWNFVFNDKDHLSVGFDGLAAELKKEMDSRPDGTRVLLLPMPIDTIVEPEAMIYLEEGTALMAEWYRNFFTVYAAIGGKLDSVQVDVEYSKIGAFYVKKAYDGNYYTTTDDEGQTVTVPANKEIYNQIVSHSLYATEVRPLLAERGFQFWERQGEYDSEVFSAFDMYSLERDIWDQVMTNRMAAYMNEVLAPVMELYPDISISNYRFGSSKGWNESTSHNGGTTNGGNTDYVGTAVNENFYLRRPAAGFFTNSSGESIYYKPVFYNKAVYEDSPYHALQFEINTFKDMYESSDNKRTSVWIAGFNYNKLKGSANGLRLTPYYSEAMYHIGMLNPEAILGYIVGERDTIMEGEPYDYADNMKVLSELMAELTRVAGKADRETISMPANWNSDFVLSGMRVEDYNIFRISPDTTEMSLAAFKVAGTEDPTFCINGQTVTFPGGEIMEDSAVSYIGTCGYWVKTDADVMPVVINDADRFEKDPAYQEDFNSYTTGTVFNDDIAAQKNVWTSTGTLTASSSKLSVSASASLTLSKLPQNITAGDSYAKQQVWEVEFTAPGSSINSTNYAITLLTCAKDADGKTIPNDGGIYIKGTRAYYFSGGSYQEFTGVSLTRNATYTAKRTLNFTGSAYTSDYAIYDASGNLVAGITNVPMASIALPVTSIQIVKTGASVTTKIDNITLRAIGVTTDFHTYDAATGMQLADPSAARTTDTAYRLSWMNATTQCKVAKIYNNGTLIEQVPMAPGADGVTTAVVKGASKLSVQTEDAHTEQILPAVAPTCTTTGLTQGKKCSACGEILVAQQTVNALGHTQATREEIVTSETCGTAGSKNVITYCSVCNVVLSTVPAVVPATGNHTPGNTVVQNEIAPTCTTAGSYDNVVSCTVCGIELSRNTVTVDALGHTEQILSAVAPTCTATGLTGGKKCTVCGEITEAQQIVNALGHAEESIPGIAATCTTAGLTEGKKCTVCGEILTEQTVIAAPGHTYDGVTDTDCNVCGIVRELPKTLTAAIGGQTVEAAAGKVYYATAPSGTVGAWTQTEPAAWNIKLDNTKNPAELTFKSANVSTGSTAKAMDISGDGALKIIVDGDSKLSAAYYANDIAMAGGTTITSVGKSLLTFEARSTSAHYALTVKAGSLTLDHAYTKFATKSYKWAVHGIDAVGLDVVIKGGEATFACNNNASLPLKAQNLTISDYAKVTATGVNDHAEKIAEAGRTAFNVAGDFVINSASLSIADNYAAGFETAWEYIFSKMPTITGATAQYKNSADGQWQPLTDEAGTANIAYPYIEIAAICTEHQYDDLYTDTDCNICGTTRLVVKPLTVTFGNWVQDRADQSIVWNVAIGEVYYATTDEFGVMTNLGTNEGVEPEEWNIKLDNTKPVAELTLKGAYVSKLTESVTSKAFDGINIVGNGALKIIIDGDSIVESGYNDAIETAMAGGTTFTSLNGSKLIVDQRGSSGVYGIYASAGDLSFEDANIYAPYSRTGKWKYPAIGATAGNITISGGRLEMVGVDAYKGAISFCGITAKGTLTINDYAVVIVHQTSEVEDTYDFKDYAAASYHRYGLSASSIIIDCASVYVIDNEQDMLEQSFNKMPTVTNAAAYYSTSVDGSDLQTLASASGAIDYPYVAIIANCPGHTGGTATCKDLAVCTICGNAYGTLTDHAFDNDCTTADTCANCDAVAEIGHSYKAVVTVPTCTEEGYTTYSCSVCGDTYKDNYVDALGHNYESAVTAPTCTTDGYTTYTCTVCDHSYVGDEVEATGHSYDMVVTAPTCTEQGYTTYTCSVCSDAYKDNYVDVLGHTEEILAAVAPTCTTTGLTEGKKCSVCGETLVAQETVDALGHTEEILAAVAPTCTTTGLTEGKKCSVCGETLVAQETVAALGHNYESAVTAPTCTTDGYTTYTCTVCDHSYVGDEVEATGHSYDMVVTAPTCTEQGYTTYTCSVCSDAYKDNYVDVLGHTEEILAAVAPTCTTTGLTEGKKCSVCGETLVAQETVDALDHTYDNEVVVRPTATACGYTVHACVCGESYKDTYTFAFAKINETEEYYASLTAAIDAAEDGQTVTLLKVSAADGALVINKSITVDFNGITYTAATAESGAAVVIGAGANVTLTNSAKLQTRYANRDQFQYLILNNGTLTTSNITLRGSNMTAEGAHAAVMNNGTLTLDDATTMTGTYGLVTANSNVTKAESVAVEAPEGYIWAGNGLVSHTNNNHVYSIDTVVRPTATACGYTVHACVCGESYKDTYTFAFAKINETEQYYASLTAAIDAAEDGQTVTLLKVSAADGALVINKSITVDFNGITYTAATAESGAAVVIGAGANVTLTNSAKLQTRYANRDQFQYLILNNGTLTISNITLRGSNMTAEGAHAAVMNNGTLNQGEGTSITGAYGVVEGNA